MISGTVTDASGRILSGQTVPAFWNSVRHAKPLTIGLNCALGAALMRPYAEELSQIADTFVCIYPNAGLPNPMSDTGFDELPADTSALLKEFAEAGFINVAGGCCGTTPDHIKAIGEILSTAAARRAARPDRAAPVGPGAVHHRRRLAVRQRRRAHQRHRLQSLRAHDPQRAVRRSAGVARQQVENGAQVIDINMDEAMLDSQAAMTRFLNLIASEPDISRVPIMIDSSKWSVIEAGLKCVQGKSIVNSISMKEGEKNSSARPSCAALRRRRHRHGLRRKRPGRHLRAQDRNLRTRLQGADRKSASRRKTSSSTRTSSRSPPASKNTTTTRWTSSTPRAGSKRTCRTRRFRAASPTSRSRSAATTRRAKRSTPCSCTTPSRPA
jgi:hypothetical protein